MNTEYLALAKSKKRTAKRIRAYIRRDLGRIKRNLGYLEDYMLEGYAMPRKYISQYLTIPELYRRQKYMFDNKTHVVENRIVSINQPFVRPMVRGKAKAQTEFGAKYDVSIDEKGHARLEKISFNPYNASKMRLNGTLSEPGTILGVFLRIRYTEQGIISHSAKRDT